MVSSKKNDSPPPQDGALPQDGVGVLLSPQVSHDYFPVLETIFERSCHSLSTALQNLASVDVDVSFKETKTLHFGRYLEDIKDPGIWGIFRAEEWDNDCLIVTSPSFLRPLLELVLGGELGESQKKKSSPEEISFTVIERHLIQKLLQVFLDSVSIQFQDITPVKFTLSSIENSTRSLVIVRNTSPCIIAYFSIRLDTIQSHFQIILPYTTIQPVRSILVESFLGEKMGKDSLWVEHINEELPQAHVELEAVLDDISLKLWEVLKWKKGSSFFLQTTPDSNIQVKCRGEPVLLAKMGQKNGKLALAVEDILLKHDEPSQESVPDASS